MDLTDSVSNLSRYVPGYSTVAPCARTALEGALDPGRNDECNAAGDEALADYLSCACGSASTHIQYLINKEIATRTTCNAAHAATAMSEVWEICGMNNRQQLLLSYVTAEITPTATTTSFSNTIRLQSTPSATSTTFSTAIATSPTIPTNDSTMLRDSDSSKLPGSAISGIVVACIVITAVLAALAIAICLRARLLRRMGAVQQSNIPIFPNMVAIPERDRIRQHAPDLDQRISNPSARTYSDDISDGHVSPIDESWW